MYWRKGDLTEHNSFKLCTASVIMKIIQIPKKYCPFCKGAKYKKDVTLERFDLCNMCFEAMLKVRLE